MTRHAHPPALGQPNPYDPSRDEGYRCSDCKFQESRWNNEDDYEEFKKRWNDSRVLSFDELKQSVERTNRILEEQQREWTWPAEEDVSNRKARAQKLAEYLAEKTYGVAVERDGQTEYVRLKRLPQNPELFARILAQPEDDDPRREFAQWMRKQSDPRASEVADFIETELLIATLKDTGARTAVLKQLSPFEFGHRDWHPNDWWHYRSLELDKALSDTLTILREEGLIDGIRWHRGFVEHVAIKAHRFLEIADELYSLAPIRYLTITYAKGLDHRDAGLWKAQLESPHLDRIRSLRFPVAVLQNEYTELNRLTDEDVDQLAASPHVRGLRHLDLEDQRELTIRAFDALASSRTLGELSAIQHDIYQSEHLGAFSFGDVGPRTRTLVRRPMSLYAKQLEERHGHIVWLHPVDYYGTEDPDPEAVVEHPAALLRPNVQRSH